MVIKPFVYQAVGNAVILLLLAAIVPRWWVSKDRCITTVDVREAFDDAGHRHWRAQPIVEPSRWAAAGQLVRFATIASAALLLLALVLARFGGPHAIAAWLAAAATAATIVGALAFVILRPDTSGLRVGIALIVTFAGGPIGLLGALALARAR